MKVLLSSLLPLDVKKILREKGIDVIYIDENMDKEKFLKYAKDCDGIICLLRHKIDREIIDNCPQLKIIANYAVGYDNIDIQYAHSKNIIVTNTPDVLTQTTADLTMGLLIAIARRIVEADNYVREGNFHGWQPHEMLGYDIHNRTLGIYGLGRIGKAVAKRGIGFDMTVIYNTRNKKNDVDYEYVDFDTLLKRSDFIVINAPLTPQTEYRFTMNEFRKMKREAMIINTARGKIIKEEDLVYALKNNIIAGAALDVYENEPHIHNELIKMKNVILTPHCASATYQTRKNMAEICVNAIIKVLIEKRIPDVCVNC